MTSVILQWLHECLLRLQLRHDVCDLTMERLLRLQLLHEIGGVNGMSVTVDVTALSLRRYV